MHGKFIKILRQYALIALGSAILAVGITQFLVPLKISSGGISTVGTILLYLFHIPISLTVLFLNGILFALGFKYLDKSALPKTVAGMIFLSLFLEISALFPVYADDLLAAAVSGGILAGAGVGIVVREDASTGGSDLAALIIHRLAPHISVAFAIMAADCTIAVISGIIFRNPTVTVYSLISLWLAGKVTDRVSVMGNAAKFAFIITPFCKEIAAEIPKRSCRGVNKIYCREISSGTNSAMLLCVASPRAMPRLTETVKKHDKNAFIIISDAKEVFGENF